MRARLSAGDVHLTVSPAQPKEFTVFARIPAWSQTNSVRVNGEAINGATPGESLAIHRRWKAGDRVDLAFDMTPRVLRANPAVAEDVGKVVLQRGPIVFCMEDLDQTIHAHQRNLGDFVAHGTGETKARFDPALLGGITVLEHPGSLRPAEPHAALYQPASQQQAGTDEPITLTLIPYYAWANRSPSAMQVWIPEKQA